MALLALVPDRLRSPNVGRVGLIAFLVIVGAALLFGDGIITPAISVLSAIEGLEVATSAFHPVVLPVTVVILVGLFFVQRWGTGGLGRFFGPIMVVWFVTIGALGTVHVLHHPAILGALSPIHGVRFFAHHGFRGFRVLGGVVLAITGGEALYADMGHFGRRPIRIAWLGLVYPALLLCYLGQGAHLIDHPEAAARPFFSLVPAGPWIYPLVALAAAATVIASQALISGVFSLTHQAIRLGYFPRVEVRHTSGHAEGQIYVPLLNWGLAICCIALVLVFQESTRLAAAYGLAVSGTMVITSVVYAIVARCTFHWSRVRVGLVVAFFLSFDLPLFAANSLKFFEGGYLPFLVGMAFVLVMVVWYRGRSLVTDHFRAMATPVDQFLATLEARLLGRVPGTAVFLSSSDDRIPAALEQVIERFRVIYQDTLLVSIHTATIPTVDPDQRITLSSVGPGIRRISLQFGFMERPNLPQALGPALPQIGCPSSLDQLVYILGRESFAGTSRNRMGAVSERMFDFLARNARRATEEFGLAPEQVIEIGMQLDL